MSGKTEKNAHLWERHPDDWYVEERFATAELFKREQFAGTIWDPCCGRGHILAEALAAGYVAIGSDIADRARIADAAGAGFVEAEFTVVSDALGDAVVMNSPYLDGAGIERFIRHAMTYPSVAKIAAFVPAKFLWGADRARSFHCVFPPSRVYMITPRPSCPPGPVWEEAPEEVGGGSEDFAWFVYERDDIGGHWPSEFHDPPQLFWIIGPDRRKRRAA